MTTPSRLQMQKVKNYGIRNSNGSLTKEDKEEELLRTALALFQEKEEEIKKRKMEVREKELEALIDPMRKDISMIHKRVDLINKKLNFFGQSCQKKEQWTNRENNLNSKSLERISESKNLIRLKKCDI
ncbi:hypothetical protein UlMin_005359 [Ulmus minor]